ncbi:hypothetical protein O6H91_16G029500 [Diphasiastrum complanatum]|uniref:Uncharacterized protein n=1 Tax=Diphasiastrum complanatum TaxID=34168 RepID=A0ACC2BC11_DIPCM|nr:hypothetical protein O6H91_16G029500 [Diphasiastrum complanatum]
MQGIMGGKGWILVALAMTMLCARSFQAPDCTSQMMQMQPCLSFVEGNVNMPGTPCCSGLSSVYKNSPVCLCELISSPGGLSTPGINITNAILLPTICKVPTDTSQCTAMLSGHSNGTSSTPKSSSAFRFGITTRICTFSGCTVSSLWNCCRSPELLEQYATFNTVSKFCGGLDVKQSFWDGVYKVAVRVIKAYKKVQLCPTRKTARPFKSLHIVVCVLLEVASKF